MVLENHRLCKGCGKGPVPSGCRIKNEYWHPKCWLKAHPEKRAETIAWLETNRTETSK